MFFPVNFLFRLVFEGKEEEEVHQGQIYFDESKGTEVHLRFNFHDDFSKLSLNGLIEKVYYDEIKFRNAVRVIRIDHFSVLEIDFFNTEISGYQADSYSGNLILSAVSFKCKSDPEAKNHFFSLTYPAKRLFSGFHEKFDVEGKWEDCTDYPAFIFNGIFYKFSSSYKKEGKLSKEHDLVQLKWDPLIKVKPKKDKEVLPQVNLLLLFISFYRGEPIDFYASSILKDDFKYLTFKTLKNSSLREVTFTTNYRRFEDFLNSIQSPQEFQNRYPFWNSTLIRFIDATNYLTGESLFLVMYNLLENLFSHLKQNEWIKGNKAATFSFSSKKAENKLSRNYIDAMAELLPEEEQARFRKQHAKLLFKQEIIKDNQKNLEKVQALLNCLRIDPVKVGIKDLKKEVIDLRNDLIHPGEEGFTDRKVLTKANKNLRKLVNLVILRIMNPENELNEGLS